MKYYFLLWIFFFVCTGKSPAQYNLHIFIFDRVEKGGLFISGNFNNWKPGEEAYKLIRRSPTVNEIMISNLAPGHYEFIFTRGSLATAESNLNGVDISKRMIELSGDTSLHLSIAEWKDDFLHPDKLADQTKAILALSNGYHLLDTKPDSSYQLALDALDLSAKTGSKNVQAHALGLEAAALANTGNIKKAYELIYQKLAIQKQMKDSSAVGYTCNDLGNLFLSAGDSAKAKTWYENTLEWLPAWAYTYANHEFICNALSNIGRFFLQQKKMDSAISYAQRADKVGQHVSGTALLLAGDIQTIKGNPDSAMHFYSAAVTAYFDYNNNLSVSNAFLRIKDYYLAKNKADSAYHYARLAFLSAQQHRHYENSIAAAAFLVQLFREKHQSDSALFYTEQIMRAKDNLAAQEKEKQLAAIYFNERISEKELEAAKKTSRSALVLYLLVGSVLVLLLLSLYLRARMRSSFQKKMAEVEMKALRAQMNPHFIFNCLTSINRYIVKSDNKTASGYLTKFARLIRLILDNSAAEYISLETELQTLKLYLEMESLRFDNAFEFEIINSGAIAAETVSIPPMLIQPYVENAIWHGLLHKETKGKLWVRFNNDNNQSVSVEIEDNGVGIAKAHQLHANEPMKRKSYGMQLTRDRINLISRLYNFKTAVTVTDLTNKDGTTTGTKVVLDIPLIKNII